MRATEQDRPDIARKRTRWKAHQGRIDTSRLVFIDETWIKTNMAPLRGWGPSGQRLEASAPFGHWKTMTFIAALRCDRISAPWVIDGPINGELFTLYVEKVLAPHLGKGRGRHPRQPRQSQGQAGPQRHPRQGSASAFPAAPQPRSQPDRAGLCQTQTSGPGRRAARYRGNLAKGRRTPRSLFQQRVRQLSQKLRICFRIKTACSKRADLPAGYIRLALAIGSFSWPWERPATFCGGLFRLNFRDDPGHELRGYFGMRFGCEVDTVEAVVIVRKNGIEDDNRDPTAPQMICYLSDVVGPSFRGREKAPVVGPRLENHEVRPVGNSGIKACEHAGRGVERTARIRYLHFIACGSKHLL